MQERDGFDQTGRIKLAYVLKINKNRYRKNVSINQGC